MKKALSLILITSLITCIFAEEKQVDSKPQLKPYGFIKGDMYIAKEGVLSWGSPSLTCASMASGTDNGATSFSAQHSRFGLKGSGALGNIAMGGVVELDFFVIASDANAKPRMRQAYAWCQPVKGLDIRFGQQWDLFSPLNPMTNNTNANLWYNGNYGFRRPQIQLRYEYDAKSVKPGIQVSVGEATKEKYTGPDSTFLGEDNKAMIPMIQGRGSIGITDKAVIGVSGVYAPYGKDREYATSGFSADLSLPLHKLFALNSEFAIGTNLNNANIFTTCRNGSETVDKKNIGYWVNAISKPLDFLHLVLGVAQEINTSDDNDIMPGDVEDNFTFYGDIIFPIGKYFSIAAEYQYFKTTRKGMDAYTASLVDIAGKVEF